MFYRVMSQSSQTSLLEEVSQWNADTCQEQMETVLPKLLCLYSEENSFMKIKVLKVLTNHFLPHIPLSDVEPKLFSKVLPGVREIVDDFIEELTSQGAELSSQNIELKTLLRNILQALVSIVECLGACIRQVISGDNALYLEAMHSLPFSVLHILKSTFQHCKNSEAVYGCKLQRVADLLQAVFKETYSLQKLFLEMIDRVVINPESSQQDVTDLIAVIHGVLEICTVIANMDHALQANTWKFVVKQSMKHRVYIEAQLNHRDIVKGLCDDLVFNFNACLQRSEQIQQSTNQQTTMTEQRIFTRTVKLCRFFANTLIHFIKEFKEYLGTCCKDLYDLYLQLHSKMPPSVTAPSMADAHMQELRGSVLVCAHPLLSELIGCLRFAEVVLSETRDISQECYLPHCLLLMGVMDMLPSQTEDVLEIWCSGSEDTEKPPRHGLFKAVFTALGACHVELALPVLLPGVMRNGNPLAYISLYEYVCTHLCAFITSLPAKHFGKLECCLLEAVLGTDVMSALLAVDSWCFLARYGSAELCAHHVNILTGLVERCPEQTWRGSCLFLLLRRLLFFMAPDHQAEFLVRLPPGEPASLPVWQHLSVRALASALQESATSELLTASTQQCWNSVSSPQQRSDLNTALSCLLHLCQDADLSPEDLEKSSLLPLVSQLWEITVATQVVAVHSVGQRACLLLALCAVLIQSLEDNIIIQIVNFLELLMSMKPAVCLKLAALDFLGTLGNKVIPPEHQSKVLNKLPALFSSMLADSHWMVHHRALQAFTQFAEETSHEFVVPLCLGTEEIKSQVVRYLNKETVSAQSTESQVQYLKQEQLVLEEWHTQSSVPVNVHQRAPSPSVEAPAKRARMEDTNADSESVQLALTQVLGEVECGLDRLSRLLQQRVPPDWLDERLQNLEAKILRLRASERFSCSQ
ncbi:FIGNL1-interacting regulator of recombination and mitosis isoform X2 [Petromyzon marinus]|uniref:FIGNL1-interacting regulator of recombination and mitosis isoform X2 n=1 Tax=Petromyzon marinus TaxID=7757 RepID=UPI003F6F4020